MIAGTGMPQLFANETVEGKAVTVRHLPSGLVCLFNPGQENVLSFPSTSIARGDDVMCSIPRLADQATLYATRYPRPLALGDEFQVSLKPIRVRFRRLKPYRAKPSKMMEQLAKTVPPSLTSRMVGEGVFTRLSVAQVGPWTIKMRVTGDAGAADFIDRQAEMTWFMTLYEAQEHQAKPGALPRQLPVTDRRGSLRALF